MGMDATINGEEVRFSGMLADAVKECGIDISDCSVLIPRAEVTKVLFSMVRKIENIKLKDSDGILSSGAVHGLVRDTRNLALLFDWVIYSPEKQILFV